ncbi:hypothetical protein [Candidatus Liberibacter asiaticus]|uniref:hypothetical protein n=1 Tax=Liberibacter asiaticus TaxID=34021 RepID=UPI004059E8F7
MLFITNEIDLNKQKESLAQDKISPPVKKPPSLWDNALGASVSGVLEAPADLVSLVTPWEYKPDPLKKNALTVDPEQTGMIGQISHGFLHSVSAFGIGASIGGAVGGPIGSLAGGALSVALAEARRSFENARDEGQDSSTATAVGAKSGIISGGGAVIPAGFGVNIVKSVLASVGVNLGLSTLDRMGDYAILKTNGYDELAEHASEMDSISVATDIVLGMAFGGLHAKNARRNKNLSGMKPTPSEVDIATGAKTELTASCILNDHIPVNEEAYNAHMNTLAEAESSLTSGEKFSMTLDNAESLERGSIKKPEIEMGRSPLGDERIDPRSWSSDQRIAKAVESIEKFSNSQDGESAMPHHIKRDINIVKHNLIETALSCFYERGGK